MHFLINLFKVASLDGRFGIELLNSIAQTNVWKFKYFKDDEMRKTEGSKCILPNSPKPLSIATLLGNFKM